MFRPSFSIACSFLLFISFANGKWVPQESSHHEFLGAPHLEVKNSLAKEHHHKVLKEKETTYVGAVLEYEPYNKWTDEGKGYGVLRKNAETVIEYATFAKSKYGVDIMVIPEYGLSSLNTSEDDFEKFLTFTVYVPEPLTELVPCHYNDKGVRNLEVLKMMSCSARKNKMYLVIDLLENYPCSADTVRGAPWPIKPTEDCPDSGYFFYNSQVVLDRKGAVIARYRKKHLFMEDLLTPGTVTDNSAVFLTDFNVMFSLQICFDILFEHPGYSNVKYTGIRDVAMSTAWRDHLPFELANAVQNSWSRTLKANLLVSGYHKPEIGKMGSGIFKGYSGEQPSYIFDKDSGNVLVISKVTTLKATEIMPRIFTKAVNPFDSVSSREIQTPFTENFVNLPSPFDDGDRKHFINYEDLQNYTKIPLMKGKEGEVMNLSACNADGFCCDLSYQYTGDENYMFFVYSGPYTLGYGRYTLGKQVCGVMWCETQDCNSCARPDSDFPPGDSFGPFTLTTSSFKAEAISLVGIHRDLSLIPDDKLILTKNIKTLTLTTDEHVPDVLVASLYGRWYCEDDLFAKV